MSNWDGFFNDMGRAIDQDNFQKTINIYEERLESQYNDFAGLLGYKQALLAQLERSDPNNPLVKDDKLHEQIRKASIAAFRSNNKYEWDRAQKAGSSFRIPGHEGPDKALAEAVAAVKLLEEQLAAAKKELKSANKDTATEWKNHAGTYAVQQVFFHALEQLVPDHPLVKDSELRKALSAAGVDVFIKNGYDINAVFYAMQASGKRPGHSWIDAEHTIQPEHRDAFRLAVHRRACARLRDNPAMFADPIRVLTDWAIQAESSGKITAHLERWVDLLTVDQKDPQALKSMFAEVCEDSPAGRELRVGSPLLFVLSQPELRALREQVKATSSKT